MPNNTPSNRSDHFHQSDAADQRVPFRAHQ